VRLMKKSRFDEHESPSCCSRQRRRPRSPRSAAKRGSARCLSTQRQKYGLRRGAAENQRLKKLVAYLLLDKEMLQE